MFVNKTVSLIETVYMLHFYLAGNTLELQSIKKQGNKSQNGKRKRLMIGCGNHRENPVNDCERTPKIKYQKILYWCF